MGLVVAKQLVELMGGTIGVKSSVGTGSEFWIDLIRDEAPQNSAAKMTVAEYPLPARDNAALRTLLYVEDNPANLLLVEHIIKGIPDIHMLSANDGKLGIELARTRLPDMILMDINLPGMSGIEALKILLADPLTKYIPIVALSANAMQRDIERGLAAGFYRYLTKPIKINEFMDTLDLTLKFANTKACSAIKAELV